jgi:hypothetical protein
MSIYIKTLSGDTVSLELGTFKNVNTAAAEALGVDSRDLALIRPDDEDGHVLPNPQKSNRRLWWIRQTAPQPEMWWNARSEERIDASRQPRPIIPLAAGEVLHAVIHHSYQVALENRLRAIGEDSVEMQLTFKLSKEGEVIQEESFPLCVIMKEEGFEYYRDVLFAVQEKVTPCCKDLSMSRHEIDRLTIDLDEELLRIERSCKMIS